MWPPMIFLVIAIVAAGIFALMMVILGGKRGHSFNVEDYQTRWLKIENGLQKDNPQSYVISIMEGDKLLDRALRELGLPGKTMGERLKHIDQRFTDKNKVWYAHKLRNQLAHESDFRVDYNTASHALKAFRQALKDLGAI